MLLRRTGKKSKNLLPLVTDFVAKLTHPMFEGIDVVRYTQMSRLLKVAEEYGKRLLRRDYGENADDIASTLVSKFPEHGFAIYPPEAREIGLQIALPRERDRQVLEDLTRYLPDLNAIGNLVYGESET